MGSGNSMEKSINKFINRLASVENLTDVFNQYSIEFSDNKVRRNNLRLYLNQISQLRPKVLLVGEAPGYHGCRFTGVPFTSEYILLRDNSFFGKTKGYRKTTEIKK